MSNWRIRLLLVTGFLLTLLLSACGDPPEPTVRPANRSNITPVIVTAPVVAQKPANPTAPAATPTAAPAITFPSSSSVTLPTPEVQAPTPTPQPTLPPVKTAVLLEPMVWEMQTWNNCAPVSAMMAFSYFGIKLTQEECAKALRPWGGPKNQPGDKNVDPEEIVTFAESKGLKAFVRENGTLNQLQGLLSAGVPIIVAQWLNEGDDIAHYRVARGYDQTAKTFTFNDPYGKGPKSVINADDQDKLWRSFNRRYIPIFSPQQEATVLAILGEDADRQANLNRALAAAKQDAEANPTDIDVWRNLGFMYHATGDCKAALGVWEDKLRGMLQPSDYGPTNKFLWYQRWPVECYNRLGNYPAVIGIAPNEINVAKTYAEMRYEYAVALNGVGRKADAIAQLKQALLDHNGYKPALELLDKLGQG
jgi:hypothetical protein